MKVAFRHYYDDTLILLQAALAATLPETNIAPENRPSHKETSLPAIHFQMPC